MDEKLVENLFKPEVENIIRSSDQYSLLDDILISLWGSKEKLRLVIQALIQSGNPLQPLLLHRIKYHSRSRICKVYSWMLRNDLFPFYLAPTCCLSCVTTTILYGRLDEDIGKRRLVERIFVHPRTRILLDVTGMHPLGGQILNAFQYALIERAELQLEVPQPRLLFHPFQLQEGLTGEFREILKRRKRVIYQELIEKTWHPDRFFHWCLDWEEKKELMD
jgi:hypothetical protein